MSLDNTYKPVDYKIYGEDVNIDLSYNAQDIDDMLTSTITSNIGAQGSSGSFYISTGAGSNGTWGSPYTFTTNNTTGISNFSGAGLHVSTDAQFDGDIKWKGRSLGDLLTTIEKRLAILTPDPAKLEHFEALQKAYKHYKTLESLCELPTEKEEK